MLRALVRCATVTVASALLIAPAPASADVVRPFAPTGFWNAPLAPVAPVDAESAGLVDGLNREVANEVAKGTGPWINTLKCSVPVYTVPADQPAVRVIEHFPWEKKLQAQFDAVPLPAGAEASNCSDAHLTVWQPSTDTIWEFWKLHKLPDGPWEAWWGGRMDHVSTNPGYFDAHFGATATSLPLVGGLIRIDELQQGHIDHALAFAVPAARKQVFSWPAQRTDGRSTDGAVLPEGARLRIDPRLNLATLNLPPATRMIAEAVQRYGMVLRDQTGLAVGFYAEQPQPGAPNPYPAFFGGKTPSQLLKSFPWSHLQVMPLAGHGCSALGVLPELPAAPICGLPYSLTDPAVSGTPSAPNGGSGGGSSGSPAPGSGQGTGGSSGHKRHRARHCKRRGHRRVCHRARKKCRKSASPRHTRKCRAHRRR
jgi:hypothetical protein